AVGNVCRVRIHWGRSMAGPTARRQLLSVTHPLQTETLSQADGVAPHARVPVSAIAVAQGVAGSKDGRGLVKQVLDAKGDFAVGQQPADEGRGGVEAVAGNHIVIHLSRYGRRTLIQPKGIAGSLLRRGKWQRQRRMNEI